MHPQLTPKDIMRFWSHVRKTEGCWLWTASCSPDGYGSFSAGQGTYRAHRVAYALECGPLIDGLFVCHHCDTPRCVRPAHLYQASQSVNIRDMVARRRAPLGEEHWTRKYPERVLRGQKNGMSLHPDSVRRGERHPQAKLSAQEVRDIRRRYAAGGVLYRDLAAQYAVTPSYIGEIIRRESRAEVPD